MQVGKILSHCDHTLLSPLATFNEIQAVLDDGMRYGVASVCIPPSYVKEAKLYVKDRLAICTVIGFPNGYNVTAVKCKEAELAIQDGADEIDMVINLGWLKDGLYDKILEEISSVKKVCGDRILKVIVESCYLNEDELKTMCRVVTDAGADYIKTSTGFAKGGATREAVSLMVQNVGEGVKVKAAGGIADLTDAEDFINLGADRLGTSRVVKAAKEREGENENGSTNSSY